MWCVWMSFDCGIMISASHNPYYDNGIKIISGTGQKIEAAIEDQIEAYIDGEIGELPWPAGITSAAPQTMWPEETATSAI